MIVVIPCSGTEGKPEQGDSEWLPRECPACRQIAVIGHGRRLRQAHDRIHNTIRVRRGMCKLCHCTLTALPGWCVPRAVYSLPARQKALERLAERVPVEQAAPECRDPDRVADPTTIRRWVQRRIESLVFCARVSWRLFRAPTLVAWDWRAVAHILIREPYPP